ncbi:LuxE/PaaK family acyltransferase [Dethiosulfovibrio salsuginis]|uniref:Phenylacetate-coenzyme A ligase PaaK, adenylate-forming domain family n=1 Tax=Dethiosulfovibrio salsuginis TaxID=561720 RepID=A0A1X7KL75_9BACT|nr:acyl-protein synthetase LuxE [Dethiosulfovibrio salsuginis]SMG41868.1 Phenylacetate-coenzyme A ligase PaaK, adenylate-forming domain family [Dethiosulfovibrio salsuginis]
MRSFPSVEAYGLIERAFESTDRTESLFTDAVRENYGFQLEVQPYIASLAKRYGFSLGDIEGPEDVLKLPPLFVEVMKYHRFLSIPEDQVALNLTSSGTGGQVTQALFDQAGVDRIQRISRTIFRDIGFCSDRPAGYLMFSYAREDAGAVGTSWSDEQEMACAPVSEARWLLRRGDDGVFGFDPEEAANGLVELSERGPVRLLGFPAFIFQMLEELDHQGRSLKVDRDSFVIAGGGWKNHAGLPMTQDDFARELERRIGLPRENVRDLYGMVEHGIPYCSCPEGHHHVPVFAKVAVRHPLTLDTMPLGEEGLLHLISPWNVAQPNCSVLSTDLVVLGEDCPCGVKGQYIRSIRRGGKKKHKGCAIAAQEILDRVRAERGM